MPQVLSILAIAKNAFTVVEWCLGGGSGAIITLGLWVVLLAE
jgi:hypothetical protein